MNEKILFVDDDKELVALIKTVLESAGYKFGCAYNGQEALDILLKEKFDLVLLDLEMPIMNGEQFLKEVKKHPELSGIRIQVMSYVMREIKGLGPDDAKFVMPDIAKKAFKEANDLEKCRMTEKDWVTFIKEWNNDLTSKHYSQDKVGKYVLKIVENALEGTQKGKVQWSNFFNKHPDPSES